METAYRFGLGARHTTLAITDLRSLRESQVIAKVDAGGPLQA